MLVFLEGCSIIRFIKWMCMGNDFSVSKFVDMKEYHFIGNDHPH